MSLKKLIEPLIHIAIWLSLYLVAIVFMRTIGPFNRVDGTLLWPVTVGTAINVLLFYAVALWLIPLFIQQKQGKKFWLWLAGLFVGLTLIETLLDFFFLEYIYSTVDEPFISQFLTNGIIHFIIVSLALGYGFTRNWLVNERRQQELTKEKLTAELNFLKTQLNPHFLFNVLNMAYSSASRSGDEQTADIIEKLSGLMRYMVYDSNVDKIAVEKEIQYIQNYIRLQKMRFSEDMPVKVTFEVKGNYQGQVITPLILIPFIENAFKYGVKLEQPSEIFLTLNFQNGEMEFTARNPVFASTGTDKSSSGVGIQNTRKRLEIMYPNKHKLNIKDNGKEYLVKLLISLT